MHRFVVFFATCATLVASLAGATRPGEHAADSRHWVVSWATAQPLAPMTFPKPPATAPARSASQPPLPPRPPQPLIPESFANQTIRMVVRPSLGGASVRIALSNRTGAEPLAVGAARLAISKGGSAIALDTDRPVTFGGKGWVAVPPGVLLMSDPVDLAVPPLTDVAVSLYLPTATGSPTYHQPGLRTTYIANGNQAGQERLPEDATTTTAYFWLTSLDVLAQDDSYAIAAIGDSITDGYATTVDASRAWPTVLAVRLRADARTAHVGVVNLGVSGNQVLQDGAGVSMLARLDRDVLSRPGVRWVVLLGGINDINTTEFFVPPPVTPEAIIAGYEQIITRCHAHGLRVVGGTLTPQEGQFTATDHGERTREAVNRWIRTSGRFDAVVDFDAVLRDPERPAKLKAVFDPGDRIHPNDLGNEAMAAAFDLSWFAR